MKPIKLTNDIKEKLVEEFKKMIEDTNVCNEVFDIEEQVSRVPTVKERALIIYTASAWTKMKTLIDIMPEEVAWRGSIKRGDNPGEFIVDDIFVYPQKVTPVHVDTDENEFSTFIYELYRDHEDDEEFCANFQGHSHVNMSTSPSGTDLADQRTEMIDMKDGFFVFTIQNKKGESTNFIYDYDNNVFYDSEDIDEDIACDTEWLSEFVDNAKDLVTSVKKTEKKEKEKTVKDTSEYDEWRRKYKEYLAEENYFYD